MWRAHTHSLSTLPALISPFCSACRGPGQQGRETQAEGDHLRLWGERVRGELSTREPAPEVPHWQRAGLRVLALPRGQRGAAPLQAQPAPPLVVPGCGLGPGPPSPPWTAGHGLSRPLPPGLLWAHLVWILDVSSGKRNPVLTPLHAATSQEFSEVAAVTQLSCCNRRQTLCAASLPSRLPKKHPLV